MEVETDVTKANRPVLRLAAHSATGTLAPVFPTGQALLETLGDLNSDVRAALTGERARLSRRGYPEDLPLPALWWGASA
jgi:antitoxin (DNA-binding transcriptional repressor) of toxin-antitoxin stability system